MGFIGLRFSTLDYSTTWALPGGAVVKNPMENGESSGESSDSPWGSQRVGHD